MSNDISIDSMNKDERSLLLYLETRAVDFGGAVDTRHMNKEDVAIAEKWKKEGFIDWGRIQFKDITQQRGSQWVSFSDAAWREAHRERRARNKRMDKKRMWLKAGEK
jgi:hypothetical protein